MNQKTKIAIVSASRCPTCGHRHGSSLLDYWTRLSPKRKHDFCERVGTPYEVMSRYAATGVAMSRARAIDIERASHGQVPRARAMFG